MAGDADVVSVWRLVTAHAPLGAVRVVLADVDGVITPGEGRPAALSVLARLLAINQAAARDPLVPALTLCTGRQAPYVELMAQMVGAFLPCSFEHGAGLYFPKSFRYEFHPALGADHFRRLAELRAGLDGPLLRSGRAFVQPGKEASMTLYPLGDTTVERLADEAARVVTSLGGDFSVAQNVHGVELRRRGMDKGIGAQWLAAEVGLDLRDFAGVGDSDPDLVFLELVRHSAAPANATPAVRERVDYVASVPHGEGLLEILDRIIEFNRRTPTSAGDSTSSRH